MSRDRNPYERTLDILRRRLRAGALGHGQPLHILTLAEELSVSATPIREALARLAGEGLIDRAATGYVTLRHDAGSVSDLYHLDEVYALAALSTARRHPAKSPPAVKHDLDDIAYLERTERMLARLGGAPNLALCGARRGLWDRLAPFRGAEACILDGLDGEMTALEQAAPHNIRAAAIRAYYRRRMRAAAAIRDAAMR